MCETQQIYSFYQPSCDAYLEEVESNDEPPVRSLANAAKEALVMMEIAVLQWSANGNVVDLANVISLLIVDFSKNISGFGSLPYQLQLKHIHDAAPAMSSLLAQLVSCSGDSGNFLDCLYPLSKAAKNQLKDTISKWNPSLSEIGYLLAVILCKNCYYQVEQGSDSIANVIQSIDRTFEQSVEISRKPAFFNALSNIFLLFP